jgi:hypothetical protein
MNPLYNAMAGTGNCAGWIQQFQQFRQAFTGDARQQVQQMLNSGRITQEQYNRAVQMAQQLRGMIR